MVSPTYHYRYYNTLVGQLSLEPIDIGGTYAVTTKNWLVNSESSVDSSGIRRKILL